MNTDTGKEIVEYVNEFVSHAMPLWWKWTEEGAYADTEAMMAGGEFDGDPNITDDFSCHYLKMDMTHHGLSFEGYWRLNLDDVSWLRVDISKDPSSEYVIGDSGLFKGDEPITNFTDELLGKLRTKINVLMLHAKKVKRRR